MLDHTHDTKRRSFVASANGHPDFPIQNLPFGLFSIRDDEDAVERLGIAIGDSILDLQAAQEAGLLTGEVAEAVEDASYIDGWSYLLSDGAKLRAALRRQVFDLLAEGSAQRANVAPLLHAAQDCTLHLPMQIGDYTDFYAGIHHATNVGKLMRPDNPLLPNYKHVPIGYHGRASSVVASGHPVRRPNGQRKPAGETEPSFGPSRNLDYELELGIWIGPGNALGERTSQATACSTTGRRATSRAGNTSRSAPSWRKASARRSAPGSSRRRPWRPSGARRRSGRRVIRARWRISGTSATRPKARSTSCWKCS
jgi:fumarylacetoacetase